MDRAKETAALAASALKCPQVVEPRNLLPNADPTRVWKEIGAGGAAGTVLLAGHEPHLGRLIAFLLESPAMVDLKKGALVRISARESGASARGAEVDTHAPAGEGGSGERAQEGGFYEARASGRTPVIKP